MCSVPDEPISSIAWVPMQPHLLALGTVQGWVKIFDIRKNNNATTTISTTTAGTSANNSAPATATATATATIQQRQQLSGSNIISSTPDMSITAHMINRAKRIKGIKCDPNKDYIIATFSDYIGEPIKIWDLRKVAVANTKLANQITIIPYFINNSDGQYATQSHVVDIAWSSERHNLLAVATSHAKYLSFFDVSRPIEDSSYTQSPSTSPTTKCPLFTMNVGEHARAISWKQQNQWNYRSESGGNNGSTSAVAVASVVPVASVRLEQDLHAGQFDNRIIVATTTGGFVDTNIMDDIACGMSVGGVISSATRNGQLLLCESPKVKLINQLDSIELNDELIGRYRAAVAATITSAGSLPHPEALAYTSGNLSATTTGTGSDHMSQQQLSTIIYLHAIYDEVSNSWLNQDTVMKRRALSGYTLNASKNIGLLSDEFDALRLFEITLQNIASSASAGVMSVSVNVSGSAPRAMPMPTPMLTPMSFSSTSMISGSNGLGDSSGNSNSNSNSANNNTNSHASSTIAFLLKRNYDLIAIIRMRIVQIFRIWNWISRVEDNPENINNNIFAASSFESPCIPLNKGGLWQLLTSRDVSGLTMGNTNTATSTTTAGIATDSSKGSAEAIPLGGKLPFTSHRFPSDTLGIAVYHSTERQLVLSICGWIAKHFDAKSVAGGDGEGNMANTSKLKNLNNGTGNISNSNNNNQPKTGFNASSIASSSSPSSSAMSTTLSSASTLSPAELLRDIADEVESTDSFERAVALSVFHGDIELAVEILRKHIDYYGELRNSSKSTTTGTISADAVPQSVLGTGGTVSSSVGVKFGVNSISPRSPTTGGGEGEYHGGIGGNEGNPMTDVGGVTHGVGGIGVVSPGRVGVASAVDNCSSDEQSLDDYYGIDITNEYVQMLSLVAMCLAGYSNPQSSIGNTSRAGANKTWLSMCQHVSSLLKKSTRRESVYLSAICEFLEETYNSSRYSNTNTSTSTNTSTQSSSREEMGKGEKEGEDHAAASTKYTMILQETKLFIFDRIGFACAYLNDRQLSEYFASLGNSSVSGLLITGFTSAGMSLLQEYLDDIGDVQSVGLLIGRYLAECKASTLPSLGNVSTAMHSGGIGANRENTASNATNNTITSDISNISGSSGSSNSSSSSNSNNNSSNSGINASSLSAEKTPTAPPSASILALQANYDTREKYWFHEYRMLLNKWQLFIQRAVIDVDFAKKQRYYKNTTSSGGASGAGMGTMGKGGAASGALTASGAGGSGGGGMKRGPMGGSGGVIGGRAGRGAAPQRNIAPARTMYCIPAYIGTPHVYLKCHYCSSSLPVDPLHKHVQADWLRRQRPVIECCPNCKKPLPRCYICKLRVGMLNPQLEFTRLQQALRNRNSNSNNALSTAGAGGGAGGSTNMVPPADSQGLNASGTSGTGGSSNSSTNTNNNPNPNAAATASSMMINGVELATPPPPPDDSILAMGKWLYFCQKCKHGGHASCIDQWFQTFGQYQCGVNGCSCYCR